MATIADFVGTWYFRGNRNAPCSIRLQGQTRLIIVNEKGRTYPGHLEGDTVLVAEDPLDYGIRGVLSSDTRRIAWSNGESWER